MYHSRVVSSTVWNLAYQNQQICSDVFPADCKPSQLVKLLPLSDDYAWLPRYIIEVLPSRIINLSLSGDKLEFYIPVFYFDLNRDWNRTDQSLFSLISTWSFPAWLAIEGLSLLVLTRGYLFHEYRDGDPRERNQPWECELYVIWRVPAAVMDPDQDIKMDFVDFLALCSLPPLNYGIAERIYYFYRGEPSVA